MLKSAIPYISFEKQKTLSMFVKFLELQQTMQLFSSSSKELQICETNDAPSMFQILNAVRDFCNEKELETIDSFLNFYDMFQVYGTMQQEKGDL